MTAALPKVFISYRRSDSLSATGRLYDRLNVAYPGMFFRDVSGIGVGVDFTKEIERAVSSSVALIAVIGPTWASAEADGKRRLDDPDDFVRLEVSSALKRNIRIIPVLVQGAAMPQEEHLPAELGGICKWNAISLVEEYYDQGLQRLIDALGTQLGAPRAGERDDDDEAARKVKELRGRAEAALAVEDWFAGIQALQAAVSLEPGSSELAARLRWAHDQHKVASLFQEGQHLYEEGRKAQALARFRQVRVAAGDYRNVSQLIQQLDGEVAQDTRRSRVRRWTTGAVATVVVIIVGVAAVIGWVIKSEFADASVALNDGGNLFDAVPSTGAPSAPATSGLPTQTSERNTATTPSQTPASEPVPARQVDGIGFPGRGRWRMTSQDNPDLSIALALENDGSFAVSMPAGVLNLPLSGGRYAYDGATGMLHIMGINNLNAAFNEVIQVFEREDDHFHARYLGAVWELVSED